MAGDNFDALRKALANGPESGIWQTFDDDREFVAGVGKETIAALMAEHDAAIDARGKANADAADAETMLRATRNQLAHVRIERDEVIAERDTLSARCTAWEALMSESRRQYSALLAERDALQAKVEAMEKDAGRLEWLEARGADLCRHFSHKHDAMRWYVEEATEHDPFGGNIGAADTARAAIDDAIKLAQPTGEKP